jgi:dTDP-4-amino-4,6-dideoxygalactose transaminase
MVSLFKVAMSPEAVIMVTEVLNSGMIGEGPKVRELQKRLEQWFGNDQLVMLNSCTSALTLALRLADVNPGDEVISTPYTMIATNCAVSNFGANIVWSDLEENSLNASIDDIKNKITYKTKAIVVTDVAGIPLDLKRLDVDIPIIVDAAHGIDSYYYNTHIANFGTYVCFSLQAIKQLTTGDGGVLAVNNDQLKRAERLKWFGMSREVPDDMTRLEWQMTQDVKEFGYKFHMNDISAAIGLANIEKLGELLHKNECNSQYYIQNLPDEVLFDVPRTTNPSWWVFPVRVKNRAKVMRELLNADIESSPMWRRNDKYSMFEKFESHLPNLDAVENEVLFIPVGWWVTEEDTEKIVKIIVNNIV